MTRLLKWIQCQDNGEQGLVERGAYDDQDGLPNLQRNETSKRNGFPDELKRAFMPQDSAQKSIH
ncbi:hypothetical protein EDD11_004258 [Mortierella claussenii]|nr:hypothetical protein EDD11_004258 [Mortierella claussenii]